MTSPDLSSRARPHQARAVETVEAILAAAAALLGEVGIERLSTNQVCARAGLTPPALYRYFPNKYALLSALGERLMERQNQVLFDWLDQTDLGDGRALGAGLAAMIIDSIRVTRQQVGAVWVLRALRAVPALHEVRVRSNALVAGRLLERARRLYPAADPEDLALAIRLAVEVGYGAIELAADDPALDLDRLGRLLAGMIGGHFAGFAATMPVAFS